MAHAYAHLYQTPLTGLRFFTVYGPWGRPDMALFKFAQAIIRDQPIELYGQGLHQRSFTYIDDIVEACVRVLHQPATAGDFSPASSEVAPYRIYNIGSAETVPLLRYVECLEQHLGKRAIRHLLPAQAGDLHETQASVAALTNAVGYAPQINVDEGIRRFVEWFNAHRELVLSLR
jgi:UDP-glucuronate 4-epimerase